MRESTVYLIRHEMGFVKIGRSTNPQKRAAELQTATPYDIELWKTMSAVADENIEKRLHEAFSEYHVRGEWFDPPADVVEETLATLAESDGDGIISVTDWDWIRQGGQGDG